MGVSSERHFYSELPKADEGTLDIKITEYEERFGILVGQLRGLPPGSAVDPTIAAEVVVHLTIRSAELRNALTDGLKGILAKTFSIVTRPGAMRDLFGLDNAEPDARFQNAMRKIIAGDKNFKRLGLPDDLLTRVAFIIAKETIPRDLEVTPSLKSRLASMYRHAKPFAREVHNKTLMNELLPPERMAALTPLSWKVVSQPDLILPDCVALGFKTDISPSRSQSWGIVL